MTLASSTAAANMLSVVDWEHIDSEDREGLSVLFGDLGSTDLDDLQEALRLATGFPFLYDSDTADPIRLADRDEIIASIRAGPEGHITVDGRRCYVCD